MAKVMANKRKPVKQKVIKILGVPRAANVAAIFALLIIVVGVIESVYILSLDLFETTILSAALFIFYIILLIFLSKRRVVKVIRRPLEKLPKTPNPSAEKSLTININNQTKQSGRARRKKN